jgi:hypothetical protein
MKMLSKSPTIFSFFVIFSRSISYFLYFWYIFSIYKGITLLKNDFLVKPELSASRVLLFNAVGGGSRSAPVSRSARARRCALASRREGLILGT